MGSQDDPVNYTPRNLTFALSNLIDVIKSRISGHIDKYMQKAPKWLGN